MLNVKKLLTKILNKTIVENPANHYIKIGNFAMCWGYMNIPSIAQNAFTTLTPTFPITFTSAPIVVPFFATGMGAGRNMLIQATASTQTTSHGSIIVVNNSGAFGAATNGAGWVAIGFMGGYCLNVISSIFSRLTERRWEYAEREDDTHEDFGICEAERLQDHWNDRKHHKLQFVIKYVHRAIRWICEDSMHISFKLIHHADARGWRLLCTMFVSGHRKYGWKYLLFNSGFQRDEGVYNEQHTIQHCNIYAVRNIATERGCIAC